MSRIKVIQTDSLALDPDVQLVFALEQRRLNAMRANPDRNALGSLVVVPSRNGWDGWWIVDGRHRYIVFKELGLKEFRCDLHADVETAAEAAALKLKFDYHRRNVRTIEHMLIRILAGEPTAVEIARACEDAGFAVGKQSGGKPISHIEAATALDHIYARLGAEGLRRVLHLNTLWLAQEQPGVTRGDWLSALALFVRDGYDEALTPGGYTALKTVVVEDLIRRARGELARENLRGASGNDHEYSALAYRVASLLRRKAHLRQRPVQRRPGDSKSRPL